jgi:hypothetical protein
MWRENTNSAFYSEVIIPYVAKKINNLIQNLYCAQIKGVEKLTNDTILLHWSVFVRSEKLFGHFSHYYASFLTKNKRYSS